MKSLLTTFLLLFSGCNLGFAQVQVTHDELPDTSSNDSKASLNNQLRQSQNAINSIGGYFNSSGYLTEAAGGTGVNLSGIPNGSILIQDAGNVGIGTFSQGTSGQYLTSAGASQKPTWGSISPGNVLFQLTANVVAAGSKLGTVSNSSTSPGTVTGTYTYLQTKGVANSFTTIWATKWKKVAGISTITVYAQIWTDANPNSAILKVDVGGQNSSVTGTGGQDSPEWKNLSIDVSSLTNGTVYDVTVSMASSAIDNDPSFLGNLISFGS